MQVLDFFALCVPGIEEELNHMALQELSLENSLSIHVIKFV